MSNVMIGMMRIGGMTVEQLEEFMLSCMKEGVNTFDLADIYGGGHCEELVGEVLAKRPELRSRIFIQTKVGISTIGPGYNSSYEYILAATKRCLDRLQTSYLDRLLIHRPDVLMDAEEVARAIRELFDKGLIRSFGVSNFSRSEIEYLQSELGDIKIACNQVQLGLGNTTMVDQIMMTNVPAKMVSKEADELLFFLKKEKIQIQCWSPFQMGFFEGSIFDEGKYPEINAVLKKYAEKYNTTKCAIATKWLYMIDKNLQVVTGSASVEHLKESIYADEVKMTREDWYALYQETGKMLP